MGSNDRTKVILMFGAVAVAAVVGIYYYFGIYAPNQRLADARSEIIEWDARWSAARGCLLRTAPGSSKVSEALAMRELSSDPWE
ncbi:MAG TPA: hypothetical protein VK427_26420, partial [Kofleriaceae bacterium]|nr:hypothetical protein [Kofleriaceae bacterium]